MLEHFNPIYLYYFKYYYKTKMNRMMYLNLKNKIFFEIKLILTFLSIYSVALILFLMKKKTAKINTTQKCYEFEKSKTSNAM